MVKDICRDKSILSLAALPAGKEDIQTGIDLLDTLKFNEVRCVGMAANMIGVNKAIIVFNNNGVYETMYNPVIIKKNNPYTTKEGCLSLLGEKQTTRYKSIQVRYQNTMFQTRERTYKDFVAEIIQHELDHLQGILI